MNKLQILLFISLLVVSCHHSNEKSVEVKFANGVYTHQINPGQSINITSAQLEDLVFIPLEATKYSLIGNISKLERDSTTGYLYILGAQNPFKIIVFDKRGNFIKNIQHHGRGPGEYLRINDFYLSDGKWIEIYDGMTQHLIRYGLKMDTLLLEKKIPFYAYKYSYLENGNYVFYKNSQAKNLEDEKYFYKILVLDSTMNVTQKALPFTLERGINISIMNPNGLLKTEKGVIFNEFHADSIYLVNSRTIKPVHILDFGKYTVPKPEGISFSSSKEKLNYFYTNTDKYIVGASQLVNSNNFFSFIFLYRNNAYFYIYQKEQGKAYIIDEIDFGRKGAFFPPPVAHIDSMFVSIYTLAMLNQKISLNNLKKGSNIYNAIFEGKKSQNPVLVLYQFNLN